MPCFRIEDSTKDMVNMKSPNADVRAERNPGRSADTCAPASSTAASDSSNILTSAGKALQLNQI